MSARCKRKTTNKKHSRNENPNKAPNSHHLPYIACSAPFRSSADTLRLLSRFPTFWLLITAAFCCVCLCMPRSILSSCFHMSFTFSTARVKASKTCATPNEIIIGACRPTFIDRQPIRELSNFISAYHSLQSVEVKVSNVLVAAGVGCGQSVDFVCQGHIRLVGNFLNRWKVVTNHTASRVVPAFMCTDCLDEA